ncbi:fidgetin-like protein 1 [Condylostylus longicornis]|uniref:fidgetin-like protein 1 n=1 Tax=Condylostylus longicornis TaxID=2530218 RepID=UPI00244E2880|nr:fidgetin-like protein 1 [Condylostylus longicornis]
MIAKWLASESGATFFDVSPSSLISKYYGETEQLSRTLFLVAESCSPAVIFIDEADSLLTKRRERDDDGSIRMKNQLLQMMDGVRNNQKAMVRTTAHSASIAASDTMM